MNIDDVAEQHKSVPRSDKAVLQISGIEIQLTRKAIKNLHLGVYPPDGQVRVSAPLHVTDDNVRLAVVSKLAWIRRQQAHFQAQPRQSQREMISGESHYVWGHRYLLDVVERPGRYAVALTGNKRLTLSINPGTSRDKREQALHAWYRAAIKARVPELLALWEPRLGVTVAAWGVKKMKTRWGSCNTEARRIWLNLELAKKPPECLEYVVVHELAHLLERQHNERFRALMDRVMPQWRLHRDTLNSTPLAHEDWSY